MWDYGSFYSNLHCLSLPLVPVAPLIPVVPVVPLVPVVPSHRFLLSADGQPKPLCFAVPLPYKLKLLEDSSIGQTIRNACFASSWMLAWFIFVKSSSLWHPIEFSMNGESGTSGHGFSQIAFHYKKTHHLVLNTTSINYQNDQENEELFWGQNAQFNKDG